MTKKGILNKKEKISINSLFWNSIQKQNSEGEQHEMLYIHPQ